jgi:protein tyrosine phosphatase
MTQNIQSKLDELGINFLNIDFDNPPEEITYEMLEAAMNKKSLDFVEERQALWRAWSRIMINPHPFGLISEKILMDTEKREKFLKDIEPLMVPNPSPMPINTTQKPLINPIPLTNPILTNKMKGQPLKKIKDNINVIKEQTVQLPAAAAGGAFSKKKKNKTQKKKKNKTQKKNIYKKNIYKKNTYKKYYGGRHDTFANDRYENVLIRPVPTENYNPVNEPPIKQFLYLQQSSFLPNLYGMQSPNQFDILSMTQMFMYLMYSMEIDYLIDLQGCHLPNSNKPHELYPTRGCNGNNPEIEMNTWREVKNVFSDTRTNPNIGSVHIPYIDLSPGTIDVWQQISVLPNTNTTTAVVHCLAGYGRTASVILFLTLRDNDEYRDYVRKHINVPYWGMSIENWGQFINDALISPIQRDEFAYMEDLESTTTFIMRINYIIYYLAKIWNIPQVVAYRRPIKNDRIKDRFQPESISVKKLSLGLQ